jgi:hypothetical protein
MPLLNGFQPGTRTFLQTLGKIAGVLNLTSLGFIALSVLLLATNTFTIQDQSTPERRAMRWIREHKTMVIVLSLIILWAIWAVGRMIVSNTELAGVVGLGSLLKLLFF